MKIYMYYELGHNSPIEMTEEQILLSYFPSWKNKMVSLGREYLISEKRCIDDWITVNWAWEKQSD